VFACLDVHPNLIRKLNAIFSRSCAPAATWRPRLIAPALASPRFTIGLRLGRPRSSRPYREFLEAFTRARGNYRLLRATRHHEIAIGGIEKKPSTVEGTSLIKRDESGEVVWKEHWREANVRALEWEMERDEPETYGRRSEISPPTNISVEVPKSKAEQLAESAMYFDLFRGGIQVLLDLGVPLPAIVGQRQLAPAAVETTAKPVEPVLRDDC